MDEQGLSAVLVDFAHTLTTEFSLQRTLDHLVERVVEVLPVTGAGVLLMDTEDERHHFVAATDDVIRRVEGLQLELGEGPCLEAYRTGRSTLISDLVADQAFPRFSPRAVESGLGALFAFPLRLGDERMGALELYTTEAAQLSAQDLSAAQTLAEVMAAYLFNARVRHDAKETVAVLEEQALHDALTGLPNRALLHDRLRQALRTTGRTDALVGVLFCDVDGLKAVNDTHGHWAGDQLLIHIVRQIEAVLRPGDTLARLSGDEFVVVCQNLAQPDQAEAIAARVLATLDVPIVVDGTSLVGRMSIGVSVAKAGHVSADEALQQADTAMYRAKHAGGMRWVAGGS